MNTPQDPDDLLMTVSRDWELPRVTPITDFDERWVQAFLALRIADLLAQISTGERLIRLLPLDRAWLKEQATQLVEDAVLKFAIPAGDPEYRPQDEDFDGESVTGHGRY